MSSLSPKLGLGDEDATRLGEDGATRIRTFRLIMLLAQELRTLMDQQLRPDRLTTQQAALITVVDAIGKPSLSQAAAALATTHQNVKQIADALARKGFLKIARDEQDSPPRARATPPGDDAPPPIRNSCSTGSPPSTRTRPRPYSRSCYDSSPECAPPSRLSFRTASDAV
jgi:DNA-binding MarR family transcriptional regulator